MSRCPENEQQEAHVLSSLPANVLLGRAMPSSGPTLIHASCWFWFSRGALLDVLAKLKRDLLGNYWGAHKRASMDAFKKPGGRERKKWNPKSRDRNGPVKMQEGCCQASLCVMNHRSHRDHMQGSAPGLSPHCSRNDVPTATATICCRNALTKPLVVRLPDQQEADN